MGARWRIIWSRRHASASRSTASRRLSVPGALSARRRDAGTLLRDILLAFGPITDLTPDDLAFFGARFWQILTSCEAAPARRIRSGQAGGSSSAPSSDRRRTRSSSPPAFTRSLVAAKARTASTRTDRRHVRADDAHDPQSDRGIDRSRVRRADQSRLDRSLAQLSGIRVACNTSPRPRSRRFCATADGSPASRIRQQGKRTVVRGDYYLAALPLERIAPLVNGPPAGRRPDAGQSARAGAERRVDERRAVLFAPRPADRRTGT